MVKTWTTTCHGSAVQSQSSGAVSSQRWWTPGIFRNRDRLRCGRRTLLAAHLSGQPVRLSLLPRWLVL